MAEDRRLFSITWDWGTAVLDHGVWYSTVRKGRCRFMAGRVGEGREKGVRTPAEEERSEKGGQG